MTSKPEITYENLSKAVAAAMSVSGDIRVTQEDYMITAHCFEKVTPELKEEWDRAIVVAKILAPWLDTEDPGDWAMNLFTLDGIWVFPSP